VAPIAGKPVIWLAVKVFNCAAVSEITMESPAGAETTIPPASNPDICATLSNTVASLALICVTSRAASALI
jgi:hypothetical protein